jgi:hypothetical protein
VMAPDHISLLRVHRAKLRRFVVNRQKSGGFWLQYARLRGMFATDAR